MSAAPRDHPSALGLRIRAATERDLDGIIAIERAAFSDPWSRASFAGLLQRAEVLFAVCVMQDTNTPQSVPGSDLASAAGPGHPDGPAPEWRSQSAGSGITAEPIAGYVVAWFVVDEAEIANIAVAGDRRRQGIGAALLDAALESARRRGSATVFLEVRDSNLAARELYASRGFSQVARRRKYYRRPVEDALVMSRVIERFPAGARRGAVSRGGATGGDRQ